MRVGYLSLKNNNTNIAVSLFIGFLLVGVAVVNGQSELIPDGLTDIFPPSCLPLVDNLILNCALPNFCLELIPSDEEIAAIPNATDVTECNDLVSPLCPIITRCPPCQDLSEEVFKCVILNSTNIPQSIIDLVDGCSLDCAPTAAPTGVPTTPTTSGGGGGGGGESTPAPSPSTVATLPTPMPTSDACSVTNMLMSSSVLIMSVIVFFGN
jgi:hypothetical protein